MPSGINCGTNCSASYNDGQMVQLAASASTGSNFTSWSGCTSVSGTTCNVTMDAVKNITATFTIQQFPVNLTKAGTGQGTVSFSPGTLVCGPTCSSAGGSYNYGTMVTLTAAAATGSTFTGWSGACTGTGSCGPMTITAAANVTATFTAIPPNKAFVTSGQYSPGSLGGITGADNTCQTLANAAGLGGTGTRWIAFLSSSTSNVSDRIGTASGWVRVDNFGGTSTGACVGLGARAGSTNPLRFRKRGETCAR
jgi:hypothetical protein